jgi:hypothetical protein
LSAAGADADGASDAAADAAADADAAGVAAGVAAGADAAGDGVAVLLEHAPTSSMAAAAKAVVLLSV